VTRADVQLSNQRQRLVVASNQRDRAARQLLNVIGLDVGRTVEASEALSYTTVDPSTPEQAVKLALESRDDLKAQKKRELASSLTSDAVRAERLPSLSLFGDYGTIGSSLGKTLPTRTIGFTVRVPIYDGGRRDARRSEAASRYKTEQIRSTDLERHVELEVRLAIDNLRSAEELVKTSEEGLRLAENEVAQAERRYRAGVTTSVEVSDAQTRLERARENRIEALHEHNLARIELAAATGVIDRIVQ
jgi:outer membrane protein TolC